MELIGAIKHCSSHESQKHDPISLIPFVTVSSGHHLSLVWTAVIVSNEFPDLILSCFQLIQHFAVPRRSYRHATPLPTRTHTPMPPVVLISWSRASRLLSRWSVQPKFWPQFTFFQNSPYFILSSANHSLLLSTSETLSHIVLLPDYVACFCFCVSKNLSIHYCLLLYFFSGFSLFYVKRHSYKFFKKVHLQMPHL